MTNCVSARAHSANLRPSSLSAATKFRNRPRVGTLRGRFDYHPGLNLSAHSRPCATLPVLLSFHCMSFFEFLWNSFACERGGLSSGTTALGNDLTSNPNSAVVLLSTKMLGKIPKVHGAVPVGGNQAAIGEEGDTVNPIHISIKNHQ